MVAMTSTRLWILNERNKLYVERKREILCWSSKSSWDSWEREGRSGRGSGRESGALKVSLPAIYCEYYINILSKLHYIPTYSEIIFVTPTIFYKKILNP